MKELLILSIIKEPRVFVAWMQRITLTALLAFTRSMQKEICFISRVDQMRITHNYCFRTK
jgi:hypothetical protein